jgi:hypothetical protein
MITERPSVNVCSRARCGHLKPTGGVRKCEITQKIPGNMPACPLKES